MGIASLVLGIISIVFVFISFFTIYFIRLFVIIHLLVLVGLTIGIVALVSNVKEQEAKGISIAGVALNGCVIAVIIFWNCILKDYFYANF